MRPTVALALVVALLAVPTAAAKAYEIEDVEAAVARELASPGATAEAYEVVDFGFAASSPAFDAIRAGAAGAHAARAQAVSVLESLGGPRVTGPLPSSGWQRDEAPVQPHCAGATSTSGGDCPLVDDRAAFAESVPVESESMARDAFAFSPSSAPTEAFTPPAPTLAQSVPTPAPSSEVVTAASSGDGSGAVRSDGAIVAAAAATVAGLALLPTLLVLYRRISRSRLLDNPTRATLFEFVKANPACSCADASRAAGVHFTTAEDHLRLLASHGFVVVREGPYGPAYFENGAVGDSALATRAALLRQPENVAFLAAAGANPTAGVSELARTLGIAKSTASRRATILRTAGLLPRAD